MIKVFQIRSGSRHAFTLLELLVVIAIIAVITTMVMPALQSTVDGGRITQATNQIMAACSLASQQAASENRTVTVRLISGADGEYRYLQLVEIASDGVTTHALDRAVSLPETVAMATNPALSTLFSLPEKNALPSDPKIPNQGTGYKYREFKFRPGGRLDLNVTEPWFLTVFSVSHGTSSATPPPNFATIQIDPVNSRLTVYRP